MTDFSKYERYQRQTLLKELGTAGQDKLSAARVVVIGAGGLGCPALQYLAAAGVGTLGIVDFDVVELSNLQRQTLYNIQDIGKPKVWQAAEKLGMMNPDIHIVAHPLKLDNLNALDTLRQYDIVIDGTDNFATRYMVNDACILLNKPLVYGAIHKFSGQTGVFNCGEPAQRTHYRDLFPHPPQPSTVPSCNEAGVLGVLPGIIGTLQAAECIKLITGIGKPLRNRIMTCNLEDNTWYEFQLSPLHQHDTMPASPEAFEQFNYAWFCSTEQQPFELSVEAFETLRRKESVRIIDVREKGELPEVSEFSYIQIPLSRFDTSLAAPAGQQKTLLFCRSGKRSITAAKLLKEKFPEHMIYSLQGGIEAWKKYHSKLNT